MSKTILIPLPDCDFDVTEVSVPWRQLSQAGHRVQFATEEGNAAQADPLLLRGVIFGQLGADKGPCEDYAQMIKSREFIRPLRWRDIVASEFDAMVLPGGHAKGMRPYLESTTLQQKLRDFWPLERPVAAICHGVLLLARTQDLHSGNSLLHNSRTTCLPKYMERLAFYLTAWKLGRYYRTYPAYVEDEVKAALRNPEQFERGPFTLGDRGTASDHRHAFVVCDGHYLSARWPGDAYLFAQTLLTMLEREPVPTV